MNGFKSLTRSLVAALTLSFATQAMAQNTENVETRLRAMDLYNQNKMIEATPLLEKVVEANPTDVVALERLAFSTFATSGSIQNSEERKQMRVRARGLALRAKDLGDSSNLLVMILDSIPEDGADPPKFSERSEVDAALNEGEAAFARGDFPKALASYARALELNPRQYEAALFSGDVYFKQNQMDKASEWFARAVEIDSNRETAYRYWGDALMRTGKMTEARDKFIDAIIAEPYGRSSWVGLSQWGQANRIQLAHLRVDVPVTATATGVWAAYETTRGQWSTGAKFREAYPAESAYRHSLAEEVDALRAVADAAVKEIRNGTLKPEQVDPSLTNVAKLHASGLLEAYILLAKPDAGIAKDYAAYRQQNSDKLRQYIVDVVVARR
jgi:tetratricopeptide (TPR) repeat protein